MAHVRSRRGSKPGFYLTLDEQDNKFINLEGKHEDNNGPSDRSTAPSYACYFYRSRALIQ